MNIYPLEFMHDVMFVRSQLNGQEMTDAGKSIYEQSGGCKNIHCTECPFASVRFRIDLCNRQMERERHWITYDGSDMCVWRMKILSKIRNVQ